MRLTSTREDGIECSIIPQSRSPSALTDRRVAAGPLAKHGVAKDHLTIPVVVTIRITTRSRLAFLPEHARSIDDLQGIEYLVLLTKIVRCTAAILNGPVVIHDAKAAR